MRTSYVCLSCQLKRNLSPNRSCLRRAFSITSTRPAPSDTSASSTARPPTAPKQTPNVRHIRENAHLYSRNCVNRNYKALAERPFRICALAEEAAKLQQDLQKPRSRIKQVEKSIAHLARSAAASQKGLLPEEQADPDRTEELAALHAEARRLKEESAELIARHESCVEDLQKLALSLPNLTSLETPVGEEPKVIRYLHYDPHKPPKYLRSPSPSRSHVTIGTELGLIDFTSSATSTGWGWYYLINEGALLENALVQFALSIAQLYGWKPVSPPSIVYSHIADACGFQPRDQNGEQQIWALEQNERDRNKPQRCLSGTAEIPLAAMYAGRDIPVDELPVKLVGASRCYRAEAGARGVDTKGLYRVHEFTKVELFGWADDNPDPNANRFTATSETLFEEMLSIQYRILTALDIPCRVLEMPTADLGASAARKRDIEALFPSRIRRAKPDFPSPGDDEGWGEVTSASICTDYQTRRLGTRVRTSSGEARFPHTVNGTALAVPRIIAAILENGWDEEMQAVVLPKALKPFMGGMDVIRRKA